jgi:hypothetical protein
MRKVLLEKCCGCLWSTAKVTRSEVKRIPDEDRETIR